MTTTTLPLRILIADDHEVMRDGTRALIERQPGWEVCGVAATGLEAVESKPLALKPDIAVMDTTMPDLNGLDAAVQIKRHLPHTEILMFTAHETDELIREVFEAGAKSYIFKSEAHHFLVDAIQSLSQHKPFFTNKVSEVLFAEYFNRSGRSSPTRRNLANGSPRASGNRATPGGRKQQQGKSLTRSASARSHLAGEPPCQCPLRQLSLDSLARLGPLCYPQWHRGGVTGGASLRSGAIPFPRASDPSPRDSRQ